MPITEYPSGYHAACRHGWVVVAPVSEGLGSLPCPRCGARRSRVAERLAALLGLPAPAQVKIDDVVPPGLECGGVSAKEGV